MKRIVINVLMLNVVLMAACTTHAQKTSDAGPGAQTPKSKDWSYEGETGPERWAEFEEGDCGGKSQSPVDIFGVQPDSQLPPLNIHYNIKTKINNVVSNGHSVQFNFDRGDYIILDGEKYELKQFHFHEAAEHTIKGVHYPLEIHLVHMNDEGKYAVLAVMAEESEKNNRTFDFLESYLPVAVGETKLVNAYFNMNDVLPEKKQYYAYSGSLTTPPCTEGVQWFVFKEPVDVSLKMIKELRSIMPVNNYRSIQPLNGRVIKESL